MNSMVNVSDKSFDSVKVGVNSKKHPVVSMRHGKKQVRMYWRKCRMRHGKRFVYFEVPWVVVYDVYRWNLKGYDITVTADLSSRRIYLVNSTDLWGKTTDKK